MAVDLPELPPPGASLLEVMFRRMLLQCHERTHEQAAATQSDWRGDPKFHCVGVVAIGPQSVLAVWHEYPASVLLPRGRLACSSEVTLAMCAMRR